MITKSKTFKGIEFVQLSELPLAQQELLTRLPDKEFVIKIQIEGKILNDCIQFKDYVDWYERQFNVRHVAAKEIQETENKKVPMNPIEEFVTEKA